MPEIGKYLGESPLHAFRFPYVGAAGAENFCILKSIFITSKWDDAPDEKMRNTSIILDASQFVTILSPTTGPMTFCIAEMEDPKYKQIAIHIAGFNTWGTFRSHQRVHYLEISTHTQDQSDAKPSYRWT